MRQIFVNLVCTATHSFQDCLIIVDMVKMHFQTPTTLGVFFVSIEKLLALIRKYVTVVVLKTNQACVYNLTQVSTEHPITQVSPIHNLSLLSPIAHYKQDVRNNL